MVGLASPDSLVSIPGFDVQKEIGRGGMAHVYLAVQNKFGRLVALKVVSGGYARDPRFRERFIRESRINARLTHPNIVQVYDVGNHGDLLYLVLEYVRGGDLIARLNRGIHLEELIRVVADICKALDYAHAKGFVHRDIKPENILFREDGSAVLSDFGIARFADTSPSLTQVGTVVGTPQYMSPEQASGRELDGRSDLYSLGVVLYRMLIGDVPYKADSAVSIGIKHLQEPVPRLPNYLAAFQPVIDRCLAKKPQLRYQTGAELSAALEAIRSDAQLPNATIRAQAVSTQEILAVGSDLLTTVRDPGRSERHARRQRRKARLGSLVMLLFVALLVGAGGYIAVEQPPWAVRVLTYVGIIEDPMVNVAWSNAQSLHQDPNQSLTTIVAGYRRVIDLDPEHPNARNAIAGLATQWRLTVVNAMAQGSFDQAETKLGELAAAFPNDPELPSLRNALNDRRRAEGLLSSTQALLRSHGISDIPAATAAIQAYQEVLQLAPQHPVALKELDSLARYYASLAGEAVAAGEFDNAINFLDRASAANPALPVLATVRDSIRQATTLQAAITDMLQQAGALRASGSLINPPGGNAAEIYHRVLATDPGNVIALQGLNEVQTQVLGSATQMLNQGRIEEVQQLLQRSGAVGLNPETLGELKRRLDAEVSRVGTVQKNIERARALLSQGYITEPQADSAVTVLREVQRMDPGNPIAADLLRQSAERLARVAEEAYQVGMMEEAKHYLELALTVTPDVTAWRELRASWEKAPATP
ncbi:MAG: protein kinase [Pseudomonadales bacterium]